MYAGYLLSVLPVFVTLAFGLFSPQFCSTAITSILFWHLAILCLGWGGGGLSHLFWLHILNLQGFLPWMCIWDIAADRHAATTKWVRKNLGNPFDEKIMTYTSHTPDLYDVICGFFKLLTKCIILMPIVRSFGLSQPWIASLSPNLSFKNTLQQ